MSISGSSLKAQIIRTDTSQYLNSSGQWQSAQAWALSTTDSAITGAGQVGFALPASYWDTVQVDDFSATVAPENFDGPTVNGLPPGWSQGSSSSGTSIFAVSSSLASSAPNGLASTATSSSISGWAYPNDFQAANVQVGSLVYLNSLIPAQVIARASNLNTTSPTYYAASITRGLTVELVKVVNGTATPLTDLLLSSGYFSQRWAHLTLDVQGTTLRAQVYRPDTAQYLNSEGAWQADQTWAVTATDSAIATPGNVGVATAASYTGTVTFDDFTMVPLPGGTFPSLLSESFDTTSTGSLPAGWSQWNSGSGTFAVSTAQPASAPNGLGFTGGASSVTARTWSDSVQAADVQVSAAIFLGTLVPTQVIARGANLNGTTPSYYAAQVTRGMDLALVRVVSETTTTLGTLTSAGFFSQQWIRLTLDVNGSALQAQVQRLDTNQYLNSLGQWQTAPAWALVTTDTSLTGAGLVGLGRVSSYSDAIYFDDFTAQSGSPPAAPPTVINESFDATTTGSLPTSWAQYSSVGGDGTFGASTTQPSSAPKSFANATTGASATVVRAWHTTFSAASARVSASVYLDTLIPAQVLARGSGLNTSSPTFYAVQISRGFTAELVKVVSGTTTVLATITSPDYFTEKWVRATLSTVGSTLQVQLSRPDTGQYLNSGGQWQSGEAWAVTVTDTSISAAGLAGVGRPGSYTGTVYFDDFSAATVAGGSDTQAPGVTITAPASGQTLDGENAVQVTASDNVGVTKVEFYLDGVLKSTDESAPYNWTWDTTTVTNGSHTLLAKAFDAAGNTSQTSVTVTTANDNQNPTASITAPTAGETLTGTKTVQATASDNVEVDRVEFYLDGETIPRAVDGVAPYKWTVDTRTIPNGAHTLKAKAIDTSGNVSSVASVSVTVSNSTDTQPPTVRITAPVEAADSTPMLYETFTVKADATDNVSVNRVEFYVDGVLKWTDSTGPDYMWDFDTLPVANGSHTLLVKAFDNGGLFNQDSLAFTILNIPRHYSHIRIAQLAYSGWTMGTFEQDLLEDSVDLVVPNVAYLSQINTVAPNTPLLIYTNVSNIYLEYLTDWLAWADAHGYNREDAFLHVSETTTFADGGGGSTRPVRNFWAAYRGGSAWTPNLARSQGVTSLLDFAAAVGDALYLGYTDRFRELNIEGLNRPASGVGCPPGIPYGRGFQRSSHPVVDH